MSFWPPGGLYKYDGFVVVGVVVVDVVVVVVVVVVSLGGKHHFEIKGFSPGTPSVKIFALYCL